jgi:ribonuclease R
MKQARYAAENLGHFGLAAACYTHFTSPIRRYPDLVVHRILKQVLAGKMKKKVSDELAATLPAVAEQCSSRERVAMEAERELVELKKVQFMLNKLGETFDGVINGVTTFGLFVELTEFFVEGMVHISTLPQDFYRYLEKEHTLVGERKGSRFRIGDQVRVVVANVSPERRQIEFVLEGTAVGQVTGEPAQEGIDFARRPVTGKKPRGWREGRSSAAGKEPPKGKGGGRKGRPRK